MIRLWRDFLKGIWEENPTFRLVIGMCPVLAVTTAVQNSLVMGVATTFVLVCSSAIISAIKNLIPDKVRIPVYIVIIATFVTIADYVLAAVVPDVHSVLGLFIPLIVVNCIILGRQEAFASKMPLHRSIADALGMGLGFTWALTLLSTIRELLGMGTFMGYPIFGEGYVSWVVMILPPGAFLVLGILVGVMNFVSEKAKKRA
jgi:electron transport complex protein RnfE